MKIFGYFSLLFVIASFLFGCEKEEVTSRNYPRIRTLEPVEISSEGAKFRAEIRYRGNFEILNYGFVWSEYRNLDINNSDKIVYSENIQSDKFSASITSALQEGVVYFVRSFIQTNNYLVYGNNMEFKSLGSMAHSINSISPLEGLIGDTLEIQGERFSFNNDKNEVFFNDIRANIISSTDTLIKVVVPVLNKLENEISLSLIGNKILYKEKFHLKIPIIDKVLPTLVSFGDTLFISGKNITPVKECNLIYVGNNQVNVLSSTDNKIAIIIPDDLKSSTNVITYQFAEITLTYEYITIKEPIISSITPDLIETFYNGKIEIKGRNFNSILENNRVRIGGFRANLIESQHDKITVEFPSIYLMKENISAFDSLDVYLEVLDQSAISNKSLILNYKSTWTRMNDFPGPLRIHGVQFSMNGMGYIGFGEHVDNSDQIGRTKTLNDLWEYNPQKDAWSKKASLPAQGRTISTHFVIDETAYIICGASKVPYDQFNNEFWEYNQETDNWRQKSNFPGKPRYKAFGFVIKNIGYIGGGFDEEGNRLHDFWKYDAESDRWTRLHDLSSQFYEWHLGFGIGDKGYCIPNYSTNAIWIYDSNTNDWTINYQPDQDFWYDISGFSIESNIYTFPGIYKYSTTENTWEQMLFNAETRSDVFSFSIDTKGYILLGRHDSHNANLNEVWEFDPDW